MKHVIDAKQVFVSILKQPRSGGQFDGTYKFVDQPKYQGINP
jgi:hypothetical protein